VRPETIALGVAIFVGFALASRLVKLPPLPFLERNPADAVPLASSPSRPVAPHTPAQLPVTAAMPAPDLDAGSWW
jgi:hypothetical protein